MDAAIDLGLDTFSMQAVADRLGVTAPALYSHVASRDEVVALADEVLRDRLAGFASDAEDWRGWLRDFAADVRAWAGATSGVQAFDRRSDPADLLAGERGLHLLFEAGFDVVDAAYAVWLTYRVAATAGAERGASFARYVDDTGDLLGRPAPARTAPATEAVQRALADGSHDTFAFDLEVVLDGLAARLERRAATPARPPSTEPARPARRGAHRP